MSKKLIFGFITVLLLAASCSKATKQSQSDNQNKNPQTNEQAKKGNGSFKDLLAMGQSVKCDTTFKSGTTNSTGTIFTAGGKMRGDFSSEVQGKTMQMHMIVKDQNSYNWVEGMGVAMGFKTTLNTSNSPKNTDQSRSVDVNQKVDYNCSVWAEDSSKFDLPTGVEFKETAAITPNGAAGQSTTPGSSSAKSQQCAACDQAGAGKAQCLAAMGCN